MKTKFIIIRHGQSEGNLSNRFAGHIDVPLTELGIKQGKCTGEFLKNEKIDAFYSSDLSRAYETACFTAEHHKLSVTKHKGLREINGGRWENLTYHEIREIFPEAYGIWTTNIGLTCCEGGESVEDVQNRFFSAMVEIAEKHKGKTVCIGTHAMALRAFITRIENIPLSEMQEKLPWVTNASVTYVDYEGGKFSLISYGIDAHLEKAGLKSLLKTKV